MRRLAEAGYTILEVMIVLTVSGTLFISAALLLSGKQAQTETTQSVRDFESQIQGVVSDVSNGYYPTISCQPTASGVDFSGTSPPGASGGCIFLGKVFDFRDKDAFVIPLVGKQYASGTTDVANLAQAYPTKAVTGSVDLSTKFTYKYGLNVTKISSLVGVGDYMALAFISELGSTSGNPITGSRSTLLYGISGSVIGNTVPALGFTVNSANLTPLPNGVYICMKGGNDQKGKITVGESGSQTSTEVFIDSGVGNECP